MDSRPLEFAFDLAILCSVAHQSRSPPELTIWVHLGLGQTVDGVVGVAGVPMAVMLPEPS